ncbi:MAG TPA: hypothetical protein VMZ31_20295 [Phycisphaerae bacterium]|nr:hypothetical protein [Phycisphaerae bacterium]
MLRVALALFVVGMVVTVGCSQHRSVCCARGDPAGEAPTTMTETAATSQPAFCSASRGLTPWLLFDRIPHGFEAGAFAFRSDWPATTGRYRGGEITYYREWSVDYFGQDRGGGDFGQLHRRFETYRVGTEYR